MTAPGDLWIWLLGGGAALSFLLTLIWPAARTAARVIGQFFATIALPVVVVLGGILALLLPLLPSIDPRLGQALIAGMVIAIGWLTTAIFAELTRTRDRAGRLRDYHKALYAEIGNSLSSLLDDGQSDAYTNQILEKMEEDDDFVPFIPREQHDHVYDAIIAEIDVLPRQTIDAIVAYYSQIKAIGALADDMRGETFKTLPQRRRMNIYADYVAMRRQAFQFGQYALRLIKAYSDGGAAAAEAISSRVGARSGRSQGSA